MEISYRGDIGGDLLAPQANTDGASYWSYELVTYAVPGDVVLHWSAQPEMALMGRSVVTAFAVDDLMNWQSPASAVGDRLVDGERPAWRVALAEYRAFDHPLTLEEIRAVEPAVRQVFQSLRTRVKGALYFPFELSDKRPLRPAQGYLVKFPKVLLGVLAPLAGLEELAVAAPEEDHARTSDTASTESTVARSQDPAHRRAVERYAVRVVTEHFGNAEWSVADVGDRQSWDLTLTKAGTELHVEVKGSTTPRAGVDLTDGEVRHAERHDTVLAVVDEIVIDAGYVCSAGRLRIWSSWIPHRGDLVATSYRYVLPTAQQPDIDAAV